MKRQTMVILCTVALLLTGCANTTPPIVTSDSSNEVESTDKV